MGAPIVFLDSMRVTLGVDLVHALMCVHGICGANANDPMLAQARDLSRKIANRYKTGSTIGIEVKVVDILVKMVDEAREKGNMELLSDLTSLIRLLKRDQKRIIIGNYSPPRKQGVRHVLEGGE